MKRFNGYDLGDSRKKVEQFWATTVNNKIIHTFKLDDCIKLNEDNYSKFLKKNNILNDLDTNQKL